MMYDTPAPSHRGGRRGFFVAYKIHTQIKVFQLTGWCRQRGLPGCDGVSENIVLRRRLCSSVCCILILLVVMGTWMLYGPSPSPVPVTSRLYTPFPSTLAHWTDSPPDVWQTSPAARVEGIDTLHHAAAPKGGIPYLDAATSSKPGSSSTQQWWNLHDVFSKLTRVAWEHDMKCLCAPHLGVQLSAAVLRLSPSEDTIRTYGQPLGGVDTANVHRVLTLPPGCGVAGDAAATAAAATLGLSAEDDLSCVHEETEEEAHAHGHSSRRSSNRLGGGGCGGNETTTPPTDTGDVVDDSVYLFVVNVQCETASRSPVHLHVERDFRETSTLCPDVSRTRTRSDHASCSGDVLINGLSLKHMEFDVAGVEAACVLQMSEVLNERPCLVCSPDDDDPSV